MITTIMNCNENHIETNEMESKKNNPRKDEDMDISNKRQGKG